MPWPANSKTVRPRRQRSLSARLVARRISKARKEAKRAYELINRPAHWLTPEKVFAAADAVLERNESPTCGAVARQLGRTRTDNTVRNTMTSYWRDVYERLQQAGLVRKA